MGDITQRRGPITSHGILRCQLARSTARAHGPRRFHGIPMLSKFNAYHEVHI
ncbi:unnamed protein product [Ectocarpus sp. 13 AM-2016]